MKAATALTALAAIIEIGAASYYLAAQPLGAALQVTLFVHGVAAIICAAMAAQIRSASFVFYVVPALLLPIGGVLTVLAASMILRSPAGAPQEDASPFAVVAPSSSSPGKVVFQPLAGALKELPLRKVRSLASGLRTARPVRAAAMILQHLQQHEDTEVRFRAQGAVTRAIRSADEILKQGSDKDTLTDRQRCSVADACVSLADWSPATGANEATLLQNAISVLSDQQVPSIPQLARLTRAQLDAKQTAAAAASLEQLQLAGASEYLCASLKAEVLYQQRNWQALAKHCSALQSVDPEMSSTARFWRATQASA